MPESHEHLLSMVCLCKTCLDIKRQDMQHKDMSRNLEPPPPTQAPGSPNPLSTLPTHQPAPPSRAKQGMAIHTTQNNNLTGMPQPHGPKMLTGGEEPNTHTARLFQHQTGATYLELQHARQALAILGAGTHDLPVVLLSPDQLTVSMTSLWLLNTRGWAWL